MCIRDSQFSAHFYCGQTAGCIKMPLGMEIGLSLRGLCVRWGPSSPSQKGSGAPPIFGPCLLWPNGWMDEDSIWHGGGPWSRPHCARWGPSSPPQKRGRAPQPQFLVSFYCGQTTGCIKMALGIEVGLSPGHIVLDGDPAPLPNFRPILQRAAMVALQALY